VLRSLRFQPLKDPAGRGWKGAPIAFPPPATEIPKALRDRILESLSPAPVSLDELIRTVEAPIGHVLTVIMELELAGRIERQAGNKVNLI
jgi:DNA processing protein